MPKRTNPFGDSSPLQFKSHIGKKEVDLGVSKSQNMQNVYDKTKDLLFKGALKSSSSPCKQSIIDDLDISPRDGLPTRPIPGQMTLDCHGGLFSAQPSADNEQPAPMQSMDTEISPDPITLSKQQMRIDPSGSLCSASKNLGTEMISKQQGVRKCLSCCRPVDANSKPCKFCDKLTCAECLHVCTSCCNVVCRICSVINYEEPMERVFCLQCS